MVRRFFSGWPERVSGALRSRAAGAMIAQVWQAVGSFGFQIVAAWLLGAAGLGVLSLCLGIIVLSTAVISGLVGDSLVVLDRRDRQIRAGLEFWTVVIVPIAMAATGVSLWATGLLTGGQAWLFAAALGAFGLEELVRRVFTATLHFWRLLIIDSTAVVLALSVVAVAAALGRITLGTFFLGLLIGQLAGLVVGVSMLPRRERVLVSLRGAAISAVAGFGGWRGAQVAVPPLVLTAVRVIVTASAGAAALGQVEAARIFVAPAMLAVQGLGSYLLASYARDKHADLAVLTRRAWKASLGLGGLAVLAGTVLVLLAPVFGPLITGPSFAIEKVAVAGWALYVAGSASLQPFASLAAARGRPAAVLACRSVDALVAVSAVWVLLVPLGLPPAWMPYAMAGGLFLGGFAVRQFVLKPLTVRRSSDVSPRTRYAT